MTSDLPDLLQSSCDAGHRCHLWLNPDAHSNPPPTFRLRTIKNMFLVNIVYEDHLRAHGLMAYCKMTSSRDKFILDPSLLSALVDRCRPETHTFHLSCGELTHTLKDVSAITCLPISGTPVVPASYSSIRPMEVQDWLGMQLPANSRSGSRPRGIPLSWLVSNFRQLPADADNATQRRYIFAYLLYLFGMMFPSSHGDIVHPSLIKIAEEIVDSPLPPSPIYSFGSALLAHTYKGLCDATKKSNVTAKGHILSVSVEFLQLWSWEYLPVGRPDIINPIHPYNHNQEEHEPLTFGSRWVHASKRWSHNVVHGCYPEYHQEFKQLEKTMVRWDPYTEDDIKAIWGPSQGPPPIMLRDAGLWLTRCNLLIIWMVEAYNPEWVMFRSI
jgi:hypothetical protein